MEFTVNLNVNVRFPGLPAITTEPGAGAILLECLTALFAACSNTKSACSGDCCKSACEKEQKEALTVEETSVVDPREGKEAAPKEEMTPLMQASKMCAKLVQTPGMREKINALLREMNNPALPLGSLPPEQLAIFIKKLKQLGG